MEAHKFMLALHLTDGLGIARRAQIIQNIIEKRVPNSYPWSEEVLALACNVDRTNPMFSKIASSYRQMLHYVEHQEPPYPYITYFDRIYPERLRQIYQAPLLLFYQGNLQALSLPALAVVGTRTATPYGLASLRKLLPPVIDSGVSIVSGLAIGIDVMAHQVTFSNQGVAIAVIGTGLVIAYPKKNHMIQEAVAQQGLLLSEYPVGAVVNRGRFPERNRIIAGLASATVVVEARKHSGSLITANSALQNNREVLAVPGSIFSEESRGCHELIQAGAKMVLSSDDLLTSVALLK